MNKLLVVIGFFGATLIGFAQQKMLFDHPEDLEITRKAVEKIYNYDFEGGAKYIELLKKDYSKHPAYITLQCLSMYQQSVFDLEKDKEAPDYYEKLKQGLVYADALYNKKSQSDEAVFFELIIHSYLALYHNENKNVLSAAGKGKRTYKYLKKGYKRKEYNPEFYLTSGLLDFYTVRYPESNPMAKPIMWFFPDGDKERGIKYIEEGAKKATFTKPECYGYLMHIYLKYQNDFLKAEKTSKEALGLYPNNLFIKCRYTEALLFGGKYEEAKVYINELLDSDMEFFKFVGYTLNGIYYERSKENHEIARNNFAKAKEIGEKNVKVTFDYLSMVYNGLARYYNHVKDEDKASLYYELSLEIAEHVSVIEEAKAYLDAH